MKNWKKFLVAGLACSAIFGVAPATQVSAAYTLNDEVANPTPSLMTASQLGVLSYKNDNPAMMNAKDKDAIVILSFGTTYKDSRMKTIDATAKAIAKEHKGVKCVTAFISSLSILKRMKESVTTKHRKRLSKTFNAKDTLALHLSHLM